MRPLVSRVPCTGSTHKGALGAPRPRYPNVASSVGCAPGARGGPVRDQAVGTARVPHRAANRVWGRAYARVTYQLTHEHSPGCGVSLGPLSLRERGGNMSTQD